MTRPATLLTILIVAARAAVAGQTPPQRPFETPLPWSLEGGRWEVATGLLYRSEVHPPFFGDQPETSREEWRLSLVDLTRGLGGGGEVRLRFGLQSFEEDGGTSESGIEDARIEVGYRLTDPGRTALALRLGVKLPNAPDDDRLGTDQTDVSLLASLGGAAERWGWAGSAGLGILGHPLEPGVQDDVALLGAAGWYELVIGGRSVPLIAEISGAAGSRFSNDHRLLRAGFRIDGSSLSVDLSVRRGLTSESERWGLEAGMTWTGGRP